MNKLFCLLDFLPIVIVCIVLVSCEYFIVSFSETTLEFENVVDKNPPFEYELSWYCEDLSDINKVDEDGNTPLIKASSENAIRSVKYLLDNGADIKYKNNFGDTALIIACKNNGFCQTAYLLSSHLNYKNEENSIFKSALIGERNYWAHFLDRDLSKNNFNNCFIRKMFLVIEYYLLGESCCHYHLFRTKFPFEEIF